MRAIRYQVPNLYLNAPKNGNFQYVLTNVFGDDFIKTFAQTLSTLPNHSFDLLILRPYGAASHSTTSDRLGIKNSEAYLKLCRQYLKGIMRTISPDGGIALIQVPSLIGANIDNFLQTLDLDPNKYEIVTNSDLPFTDDFQVTFYTIGIRRKN